MYAPAPFAVTDAAVLRALMAQYGFATLVSSGPAGLAATHVPVFHDPARGPHGALLAHLARANPHAAALDGAEVLAIFAGPHGYVSPSWYAQHPAVPTWNYVAVHVHGRARRLDDPAELRDMLARLVEQYEAGRPSRWSMASLPANYLDGMVNGIVGFEIAIDRIEGKHKLSQNRPAEDRRRVIAALEGSVVPGDRALADYMARHAAP